MALVCTSTIPRLIELVEKKVGAALPADTEAANYQDPSILAEVRDTGHMTVPPTVRLVGMHMKAVMEGADAVLNLCSSVGEVADAAQDIDRFTGAPIVRVDEKMCREAVRQDRRIGVMAILPTTLNPIKNTILRVAREMNYRAELVNALVDGTFDPDRGRFKTPVSRYTGEVADQVDVILFTRGPMAYCEECIHEKYGKMILFSPRFGAAALEDAPVKKGLL